MRSLACSILARWSGGIAIGGGTPAAAVANGGNTGNGTCGTVTSQTGEQVGTYTISFTAATAFNVLDPKGVLVGTGVTGTAFANQIGFTITAGGTAFAAGDSFTVAVPPGAYTANAGNTGNGTCGAITAKAGIQAGTYTGEFFAATKFTLFDPSGRFVGEGTTGTAFSNQLGFTITAGGTAFVLGDGFTIAVQPGNGNVTPLNLSAVDGSAVAMGVVVKATTVPAAASAPVVVVERQAVLALRRPDLARGHFRIPAGDCAHSARQRRYRLPRLVTNKQAAPSAAFFSRPRTDVSAPSSLSRPHAGLKMEQGLPWKTSN